MNWEGFKQRKKLIRLLKDLYKIYPNDPLENNTLEKIYKKYDNDQFSFLERLNQNGLIEENSHKVQKIYGKGIIKNGKFIPTKNYSKEELKKQPSSVVVPIISQKGIEYLNLRKQEIANRILIFLTIITLLFGVIEIL
jgi:hypothetical protein